MSGLLYYVLRALVRVALAVYFSRIEVEGEEDVPEGPIVIAATHPNAFIDVALVGTRLRRRVRFVAKAPLFKNPLAGWFLRTLGAVPVERKMERQGGAIEATAQDKNAQSLSACEEAVASGGAVLIFPEGTSEILPRLLPLKTGVARIAIGAEERRAKGDVGRACESTKSGVHVVPVAVRYDDPTLFRSRARVQFLPAIPVAPFAAKKDDPQAAVRALTNAVKDALEGSVVHVEDDALAPLVAEVDQLYGRNVAVAQTGGARLAAAPAISRAVNAFAKEHPERVAAVKEKLATYKASLDQAKLEDRIVRPLTARPTLAQNLGLVAAAPLAVWGIVNHWLPYQVPRLVVSAFVKDETFVSTVKLVTGTLSFVGLYALEGFFAVKYLGAPIGLALTATVPLSGVAAVEWIEAIKARQRRRRRRALRAATPPLTLRELERQRDALLLELDRARADFLVARQAQDPVPEEGLA